MSIRATVGVTGVAKNTIVKLLADLGEACSTFLDGAFNNLNCKVIAGDQPTVAVFDSGSSLLVVYAAAADDTLEFARSTLRDVSDERPRREFIGKEPSWAWTLETYSGYGAGVQILFGALAFPESGSGSI
jgi:uncharacterized protein (DUF2237 family)